MDSSLKFPFLPYVFIFATMQLIVSWGIQINKQSIKYSGVSAMIGEVQKATGV